MFVYVGSIGETHITARNGRRMKQVTVYRVDYVKKTRVPIGHVVERRTKERGDNLIGLLRLARQRYSSSPQEALEIAVDRAEAMLA